MDRRESRMKDMQTQTENTNYGVQGPQGEDQAQMKMNDEPPSAGRDQEFGKRKCPEDVDEASRDFTGLRLSEFAQISEFFQF